MILAGSVRREGKSYTHGQEGEGSFIDSRRAGDSRPALRQRRCDHRPAQGQRLRRRGRLHWGRAEAVQPERADRQWTGGLIPASSARQEGKSYTHGQEGEWNLYLTGAGREARPGIPRRRAHWSRMTRDRTNLGVQESGRQSTEYPQSLGIGP